MPAAPQRIARTAWASASIAPRGASGASAKEGAVAIVPLTCAEKSGLWVSSDSTSTKASSPRRRLALSSSKGTAIGSRSGAPRLPSRALRLMLPCGPGLAARRSTTASSVPASAAPGATRFFGSCARSIASSRPSKPGASPRVTTPMTRPGGPSRSRWTAGVRRSQASDHAGRRRARSSCRRMPSAVVMRAPVASKPGPGERDARAQLLERQLGPLPRLSSAAMRSPRRS